MLALLKLVKVEVNHTQWRMSGKKHIFVYREKGRCQPLGSQLERKLIVMRNCR